MKQYCRYCCNAYIQGDDVFCCDKKNKLYSGSTGKTANNCKYFEFNPNDLFGMDENGDFKQYTPRPRGEDKRLKIGEL